MYAFIWGRLILPLLNNYVMAKKKNKQEEKSKTKPLPLKPTEYKPIYKN
jgi:hypothetical protein